jgi:predicted nucleotidyltransferase
MNIFYEEHRIILDKLIDKGIDFILIGGYAVNYHGYNRSTGDMDLWIKPDNANKLLLLAALIEIGYDKEGISTLETWDFTLPQSFYIGNEPERTDFMTHISGVNFNEAKGMIVQANIDGLLLPIIHINTLIQNKKASTRGKDRVDAEYLEKIIQFRNRKS